MASNPLPDAVASSLATILGKTVDEVQAVWIGITVAQLVELEFLIDLIEGD
jgi:hypothetical protein